MNKGTVKDANVSEDKNDFSVFSSKLFDFDDIENTDTKIDDNDAKNVETNNEDENFDFNDNSSSEENSLIEYKEIEEPCVSLTIVGENRLTTSASIVRHGIRFSIKAFFSSIFLTIMNMFI